MSSQLDKESPTNYWQQRAPGTDTDDNRPPLTFDGDDSSDDESEEEVEEDFPGLRDYQEEAVQRCMDALDEGINRIGVSAPTGSGKTVMFATLIDRVPNRGKRRQVLVLVHSTELASQAHATIERVLGPRKMSIEQGGSSTRGKRDITVATWQCLQRKRLEKFKPSHHKLIIVDECHHACAAGYMKVLQHFNTSIGKTTEGEMRNDDTPGPKVPVIGFSATMARRAGDSRVLGWVFQQVVYDLEIQELLKRRCLAPIEIRSATSHIDDLVKALQVVGAPEGRRRKRSWSAVSNEESEDGEIVRQREIERAMTRVARHPDFNSKVLQTYQQEISDCKSALIFVATVKATKDLVKTFQDAGYQAQHIVAGTGREERARTMRDFRDGKLPILINCLVLSEGADMPTVDAIILARPTKSRNYFSQMIGRGLRTSPSTGKESCIVIDLFGEIDRFGLGVRPDLWGRSKEGTAELEEIKEEPDSE